MSVKRFVTKRGCGLPLLSICTFQISISSVEQVQIPQRKVDCCGKGRPRDAQHYVRPPGFPVHGGSMDAEVCQLPQSEAYKQCLRQAGLRKFEYLYTFPPGLLCFCLIVLLERIQKVRTGLFYYRLLDRLQKVKTTLF